MTDAKDRHVHDIYDPPGLEQEWTPPRPEPLIFTTGDLMCLVGLCAVLFAASVAGLADGAGAGDRHGGGRRRW